MCLKEYVLWKNDNSFKKNTEKVVLLQVKDLMQIIVKFNIEKVFRKFLPCTKYPFKRTQNIYAQKQYCGHLKTERLISVTQFGS